MSVVAVLLGAGAGRRFGQDKRLQQVEGVRVAERTCTIYQQVFAEVHVVVRTPDDPLVALLPGAHFSFAADAELGMGHSLGAAFKHATWPYAFVGLLDMPFIAPTTLQALLQTARQHQLRKIVRPRLQEADTSAPWGHPIGWPQAWFEQLAGLQGDQGARALLLTATEQIIEFPTTDTGVVRDIDTPQDLPASWD